MTKKPKKISVIIAEIVESCVEDGTVTVGEFLDKMGTSALALAIFVFALATVVAGAIPGFSTITAIAISFISLQMLLGRSNIYLPEKVRDKHISPKLISGALSKTLPALRLIEKLMRPRLPWLTGDIAQRLIAVLILVLSCVLALPIPGGNLPPSIAITLLSMALLERDGVLVLITLALLFFTAGLMWQLLVQAWVFIYSFF